MVLTPLDSLKLNSQLSIRLFTSQKRCLKNFRRLFLRPSLFTQFLFEFVNVFQHLLFKFILILGRQALSFSVTVDLPFLHLDDVFHSFLPIMDPQGMEGPAAGWRRKGCSCPENTLNSAIVSTFNLQLSFWNSGDLPKPHAVTEPFKRSGTEKINPDF